MLVGEAWEKELLVRRRCRWEYNIKMDVKGKRSESVDWLHVARYRPAAGFCERGNETCGFIKLEKWPSSLLFKTDSAGICFSSLYRHSDTIWWPRFSQCCCYSACSGNPWFHIWCPRLHHVICNAIFATTASGVHLDCNTCRPIAM
jgi:hypothetical protein